MKQPVPVSVKRQNPCTRRSSGYTLIELGMIIAVVAIVAAFGMVSLGNTGEQRDASVVQSAQASLQTIVSQGATRMDVSPKELRDSHSPQILYAIQATIGQNNAAQSEGVQFSSSGNQFVMTISSSGREATFEINDTGDVNLISVRRFTMYEAKDGIIQKI